MYIPRAQRYHISLNALQMCVPEYKNSEIIKVFCRQDLDYETSFPINLTNPYIFYGNRDIIVKIVKILKENFPNESEIYVNI